jgi:hypothetical protein
MPHVIVLLVLALTLHSLWASQGAAFDRQTLDAAVRLAGLESANLPITLAAAPPASASRGIEAWTSYDAGGTGGRIFIYTGSDMFRCARWPFGMRQCRIRLASALVHEAWHFAYGQDEEEAYDAQIAFLMRSGAATEHVKAVHLARDRVVAGERREPAEERR